jgi:hypothetical protein
VLGVSHPGIAGVKLDVGLCSLAQLERQLDDELADLGRVTPGTHAEND